MMDDDSRTDASRSPAANPGDVHGRNPPLTAEQVADIMHRNPPPCGQEND